MGSNPTVRTMKQILVDEDRYEALEALYAILRFQSEMGEGYHLRAVGDIMFELSKNTSVLGPSKSLIEKYEQLAKTEQLFRNALAEIANGMDAGISASSEHARQTLDEWYKNR